MRVLITGVSDANARDLARTLLAAGHDVVGVTAEPHRFIDPAVELVVAATADDAAAQAVNGADVVVHLATDGHAEIAAAAMAAGIRVVLTAPAGGTNETVAPFRDADVSLQVLRTAPLAGRRLDAASLSTVAGLLENDVEGQVLHHDDLVAQLAEAAVAATTGEVTLVAAGTVSSAQLRQALTDAGATADLDGVTPNAPVSGLVASADVELGWSAVEAITDAARALCGRVVADGKATQAPGRWSLPSDYIPNNLPATDNGTLVAAGPTEYQGEFDTLLDPRLSVLTATNMSEALPRPLTPMTIDLHLGSLRYANRLMGEMLALEGAALEQNTSLVVAVLGHATYINASVGVNVVENMPGWDEESVRRDVYGNIPADVVFRPQGGPPMPEGRDAELASERAVGEIMAKAMTLTDEAERVHAAACAEILNAEELAALSDAELRARVLLWRDRLSESWSVATIAVMIVGAASAMHYSGENPEPVAIDVEQLESAQTMLAVEAIAAVLRGNDELTAIARAGDVDALRTASPEAARVLDERLARMGHRGPGECELENPSFNDRPSLLVTSAAGAAQRAAEPRAAVSPPTSETGMGVVGASLARERARDAVVLYTNALRLGLREQGRRMVAAAALTETSDVFYLTLDEVFAAPADAAARVARRREERGRLRSIRMPDVVVGTWQPADATDRLEVGGELTGTGVFPGTIEGRVKVLRGPDDDIEPDDVLVASVTDVGHTAMFGYAAAVVTDIGGVASHAAIVAREFGVPCVVDTKTASLSLDDGQWVRVDGAAGTITLLAEADAAEPSAAAVG